MSSVPTVPDRNVLAGRIQGFGNVNPPPIEDETGSTIAKRAVGRLGDMVGEEVMLTVEDFREKGAVGAVKDAVADAGDILIDGVSGIIGWIRGDAPPEEESEKTEDATKALSNGPNGAAYGISQASPTGGINAVWVMPEEADPQALAQLASQQGGGLVNQQADPRVPKNIQPYQPAASRGMPAPQVPAQAALQLPGGPVIAPYQPAPSGPAARVPPFVPGANLTPGFQQSRWGPGGLSPAAPPGASGSSGSASGAPTGAKGLVERIAKGEVLVGPDVAKRLVSQCTAAKITSKQLSDVIAERTRRLYLGLDGGDQTDADAALGRMLGLVDALAQQPGELAKGTAEDVKKSVHEELLSLRSSAKHKDAAEPMLQRLGLVEKTANVDLLGGGGGGGGSGRAAPAASTSAQTADLLGGGAPAAAPATADLLGTDDAHSLLTPGLAPTLAATAPSGVAALDPLLAPAAPAAASTGSSSLLQGLAGLDVPAASSASTVSPPNMAAGAAAAPMGGVGMAALAAFGKPEKKEDAFGFVGAEMAKASSKP